MDSTRVISLVEGEIQRKESMAKLCEALEANQHLEVAAALRTILDTYRGEAGWS